MISSNRLFQKFGAKTPVNRQFAYNRRKLAPMVEVFESRELLNGAWAGGFLTGTVFNDANKDATLDKGDAYLSGGPSNSSSQAATRRSRLRSPAATVSTTSRISRPATT